MLDDDRRLRLGREVADRAAHRAGLGAERPESVTTLRNARRTRRVDTPPVTHAVARAVTGPRLVLLLTAASAAFVVGALVLLALSWGAPLPDSWGFRGYHIIHAVGFTAVGAIVALRRPANAIGWLLLSAGFVAALGAFGLEYGIFAIVGRATALPGGVLGAWLGSWTWVLYVAGILPFLLLSFPDGRLLSPRWRLVAWAAIPSLLVTAALMAFKPGPLQEAAYTDNPFTTLSPSMVEVLAAIGIGSIVPVMGGASWSLVLRFRRSTGIEREQIKWLAFSAIPLFAAGLGSAVLPDKLGQVLFVFLLLCVPAAVGIAVLRYRLYDINVLINRALVYGTLSAMLIGIYVATVVLVGAAIRPFTSGSELAVAVSTLATLGLIQPLRRRIQAAVDRRFYRSRYDAVRTLDAFSVRLRDEVDLDAVRAELVSAARGAVQPAHASVWLR
jgi:hypothetical protein